MKIITTFLFIVAVFVFSVSSILASDFGLRSAVQDLEKTCQAYLDSGDFEKAREILAKEYAMATTERKRKALVAAYVEIKKLKEFAEAWATPLEDVATITKTEENGKIVYHFDFHKNKK